MFKNPFSFKGRIRRLEYGFSLIIYIVFASLARFILISLGYDTAGRGSRLLLSLIILGPGIYFLIAQCAKRCHDRGQSGWWALIPLYNIIIVFFDGQIGPNEYGENPKGLNYQVLGRDLNFKDISGNSANAEFEDVK